MQRLLGALVILSTIAVSIGCQATPELSWGGSEFEYLVDEIQIQQNLQRADEIRLEKEQQAATQSDTETEWELAEVAAQTAQATSPESSDTRPQAPVVAPIVAAVPKLIQLVSPTPAENNHGMLMPLATAPSIEALQHPTANMLKPLKTSVTQAIPAPSIVSQPLKPIQFTTPQNSGDLVEDLEIQVRELPPLIPAATVVELEPKAFMPEAVLAPRVVPEFAELGKVKTVSWQHESESSPAAPADLPPFADAPESLPYLPPVDDFTSEDFYTAGWCQASCEEETCKKNHVQQIAAEITEGNRDIRVVQFEGVEHVEKAENTTQPDEAASNPFFPKFRFQPAPLDKQSLREPVTPILKAEHLPFELPETIAAPVAPLEPSPSVEESTNQFQRAPFVAVTRTRPLAEVLKAASAIKETDVEETRVADENQFRLPTAPIKNTFALPVAAVKELRQPETKPVTNADFEAPSEPEPTWENVEFEVPQPLTWQEQLNETIQAIEGRLASSSLEQREQLQHKLQLLRLLPTELDQQQQKYLGALTHLLQSTGSDDVDLFQTGQTLSELRNAVAHLEAVASMSVVNAQFCTKVDGFGQFKTLDSMVLKPQQQVLVYCEIQNHTAQNRMIDGQPMYSTRLKGSYVIYDSRGRVAQQEAFPMVEDLVRQRRQDFYMHIPITLGDLLPGQYTCQVMIDDVGGEKSGSLDSPVEFQVR